VSTAKSLYIRRETDVWGSLRFLRVVLAEVMNASPNGAPRWWTFGCSVMSWRWRQRRRGQRRRRHGRMRSSGSWSLARSLASGTNLGARLPRL
jgi:hypothetical protein